ncbi:helicase-related protein [Deinococcus radiopugnans]|uniref:helicase-related protein n=1 Tax=Deinococcus radiopugnans TaxID=57497 RepID=UPI001FDEFB19|nr:helicase-related protein [Deinococcus radiopugnans]
MDAEQLASGLLTSGQLEHVSTYLSAMSLEARERAEDAMSGSEHRNVCLTCTSAMELGIDIGDLDRALMWGPPPGVSSLLQRWGRTGRRAGRAQETTLYTLSPADTLTALAEITLAQEGWVEPVTPPTRAYHILFQQMLNRVLQAGGLTPAPLWAALQGISAFRDITGADFTELLTHLLTTGLLADVGGTLVLGDAAERQLGRRRFQALITSFDAPDVYTVMDLTQRYEVGQLESWFVDELQRDLAAGESKPVILLTGRAWQVQRVHLATATIDVLPDRSGQAPKWQSSSPRLMHPKLAWRHRELLLAGGDPPELDPVAAAQVRALRSQHQFLRAAGLLCQVAGRRFTLHTYTGTRINKTLEVLLRPHVAKVSAGNFELSGTLHADQDARELLERLQAWSGGISDEERQLAVQDLQPLPLSKYLPYLPPRMRQAVVADHLLDIEGLEAHLLAQELRLMRDAAN